MPGASVSADGAGHPLQPPLSRWSCSSPVQMRPRTGLRSGKRRPRSDNEFAISPIRSEAESRPAFPPSGSAWLCCETIARRRQPEFDLQCRRGIDDRAQRSDLGRAAHARRQALFRASFPAGGARQCRNAHGPRPCSHHERSRHRKKRCAGPRLVDGAASRTSGSASRTYNMSLLRQLAWRPRQGSNLRPSA